MEIEDPKKEQIDLENETEIEPPSFNTYPKSLETNSKRPTFVKSKTNYSKIKIKHILKK